MTPTEIGLQAACNFEKYQHAQTRVREVRHLRDYASVAVDLAQVNERCHEVQSQSLESIGKGIFGKMDDISIREQELIRIAARYVAYGRV